MLKYQIKHILVILRLTISHVYYLIFAHFEKKKSYFPTHPMTKKFKHQLGEGKQNNLISFKTNCTRDLSLYNWRFLNPAPHKHAFHFHFQVMFIEPDII